MGLKLGLKKDEVKLVPFQTDWKAEFEKVKAALIEHTSLQLEQIEHIGSTAINGIQAKPVIDILVGVKHLANLDKPFFKDLQKVGFYRLRVERPEEIVCAKFTDDTFETKTHFIHIVEWQSTKWCQMLFFRDYLNENEDARKQYEELKTSFFKTDLSGINDYTHYKEQFVQSIFAKMEGK